MEEKYMDGQAMDAVKRQRLQKAAQAAVIIWWVCFLRDSDSYYITYVIVAAAALFSLLSDKADRRLPLKKSVTEIILSCLFALAVTCANYPLFTGFAAMHGRLMAALRLLLALCGGYAAAWSILSFSRNRTAYSAPRLCENTIRPRRVFFASMLIISALNILMLFAACYPGSITADTVSQLRQILSGSYSNHHPIFHTLLIKLFFDIGMYFFNNIPAALSVYAVFQILTMAACFSYMVMTLCQMRISKKIVALIFIWCLIMPFNIMYSYTVLKDVIFGGATLVFVVAAYRYIRKIGAHPAANVVVMTVGALGICLFRSNGWMAFLVTAIVFFILFGRSCKKICLLLLALLALTYGMKHYAVDSLGIAQPDAIEYLSIPAQQIARVVKDSDDLSEEQAALLEQIIDVDAIAGEYEPYISDPIKGMVREKGNLDYLSDNLGAYLKLYIQLGLSHPSDYFHAYVDQTRGYWNGGYDYWKWRVDIYENELFIERVVNCRWIHWLLTAYLGIWTFDPVMAVFTSIGFHSWLLIWTLYLSLKKKDRVGLFLTVPVIALIGTLLVTTPVYSEFRYAYPMFCCIPFLLCVSIYAAPTDPPLPDEAPAKQAFRRV